LVGPAGSDAGGNNPRPDTESEPEREEEF